MVWRGAEGAGAEVVARVGTEVQVLKTELYHRL